MRLERLAQHDERKERPDRGDQPVDVAHRVGNHGRGLAHPCEHGPRREHQQRDRNREHDRQDQPALQAARDRELVARAERLRDDRVERHQHTHPEDREHEMIEIAERDGRERLRRHAPDHDRVDDAHQHRADLDQHERRGEPEQRLEVRARRPVLEPVRGHRDPRSARKKRVRRLPQRARNFRPAKIARIARRSGRRARARRARLSARPNLLAGPRI